jgi:hypothetical protein
MVSDYGPTSLYFPGAALIRPEILHIFTVDAHYASHKDTLTIWRDDWVLICTQVHDLTYHFEVNGYFKYFDHPEYVL